MIRPIQYLRALAAMMIVWHHGLWQLPGVPDLIHLPAFGESGVDLFFVISGFIMLVTTTEKPLKPWEFFELRIVRVLPLYWLATLLMIACALIAPSAFKSLQFTPAAVAKSLLFIPYDSLSFPGCAWPVLVPGWTLNFEMFFYCLFAISLAAPQHMRLPALAMTLGSLVVAGIVWGPFVSPIAWVYTSPLLLEFAAGAAIGYLWTRKRLEIGFAVSLIAIGLGWWLLCQRNAPPLLVVSQMVGAVLVVMGCLHASIRSLNSRLLLALGDASYSIYLTHIFTLGALRVAWVRLVPQTSLISAIAFMVVALTAGAAAGWVCYRWIEMPLTKRLRRLVKRNEVDVRTGSMAK